MCNIDKEENIGLFLEKARMVCSSPVDWNSILELRSYEGLKQRFDLEWVKAIESVACGDGEAEFVKDILFGYYIDEPDELMLEKIQAWKPRAEAIFPDGLKNLKRITFIRPSNHKKHFNIGGSASSKNIFHFYADLEESQLANLLWGFLDYLQLFDKKVFGTESDDDLAVLSNNFWVKILEGEQFRFSVHTINPIGEQEGKVLNHIALDVDLGGGINVHAYPIREDEATRIMRGMPIPNILVR